MCSSDLIPGRSLTARARTGSRSTTALAAATLVFFVVTLDAVIVNVALPRIRMDLGGGITGMQWVVDGYTLMFAALLLSTGFELSCFLSGLRTPQSSLWQRVAISCEFHRPAMIQTFLPCPSITSPLISYELLLRQPRGLNVNLHLSPVT